MNLEKWFRADTWRLSQSVWRLIIATFAAFVTMLTTSWLSLACFAILVGTFAYCTWQENRWSRFRPLPMWLVLALALAAYIAFQTKWSADPKTTFVVALVLTCLPIGIHVLNCLVKVVPTDWLEHMTRAMIVASAIAIIYLAFELVSQSALKRFLFWPFRAGSVDMSGVHFNLETVVKIAPDYIKWLMPGLSFVLWPLLLIYRLHSKPGTRAGAYTQMALFATVCIIAWFSNHRTSVAALAFAAPVFVAAHYKPEFVRKCLGVAWVAAFAAIIPLSHAIYSADLQRHEQFVNSLNARFVIWGYTATEFAKQPWLGVGAGATKLLDHRRYKEAEAVKPADMPYALRTGPHAHNIYLQSWYELGVVGTLLLVAFGVLGLATSAAGSRLAQPHLLATFATAAAMGGASFGLFEIWFPSAFAIAVATCLIAVEYDRRLEAENIVV